MTTIAAPFSARPPRSPRAREEDAIQAGIVAFLRATLPVTHIAFAVPNGGLRSKAEARRMKTTGTLAGIFDICVLGPGGATWWIEVKKADGALSDAQRQMRTFMEANQIPHGVVRSIDEVQAAARGWGLPLRGRAA